MRSRYLAPLSLLSSGWYNSIASAVAFELLPVFYLDKRLFPV
jgi:hypothetical protein